jgi:hypothetical protein
MQNPILDTRKSITVYAAVWIIVLIFFILLLTISGRVQIGLAIVDGLVSNLLFAVFGVGLWFPIFYSRSGNEKLFGTLINHLFTCLATVGIWILLTYFILVSLFHSNDAYVTYMRESIPWRSGIGVLFYGVIILVYYLFVYYRGFRKMPSGKQN